MVFFFHRFSDNNYCRKQISRAIGRKTDKAPKSRRREKSCLIFCCKGVENVIDNFLYNYCLHDTSTPVAAVLDYPARRPNTPGRLFILENGAPLSWAYLVKAVRETLANAGVSTTVYCGHSFRVGAASAVASAGLPDSTIQSLGHWKSSAFLSYIRLPVKHLISVSQLMIARQYEWRVKSPFVILLNWTLLFACVCVTPFAFVYFFYVTCAPYMILFTNNVPLSLLLLSAR